MEILMMKNILVGQATEPYSAAIDRCGRLLVDSGYIKERYIQGMHERDKNLSTAIGNYIAIPHGEKQYKEDILHTGISVLAYPEGLDWAGEKVYLVIGIAGKGEEHLDILANIVEKLETGEDVLRLAQGGEPEVIYRLLAAGEAV